MTDKIYFSKEQKEFLRQGLHYLNNGIVDRFIEYLPEKDLYEHGKKDEQERLKKLIISYNDIDTEVILERLLKS